MLGFTKSIIKKISLFFLGFTFLSCENNYQPKPRGYNQIFLPQALYTKTNYNNLYSFERNSITKITANENYGWLNLSYLRYKAELLITYKKVMSSQHLDKLINESYKLINKHKTKASSIKETEVITFTGKRATLISIEGEVPTPFQFIITDSSLNFLRAALYFEKPLVNDSISPAVEYIKKDMIHILNTLEWNE